MVWTIDGLEVIRLGDATTHGGKVVSAAPSAFYDGIPIARVGDSVTCPKCSGTHTIVSGAPTAFDDGQNIARHGDSVSCGAKLISRNGTADGAAGGVQENPLPCTGPYDEQVVAYDEDNVPVCNCPYYILDGEGNVHKGVTDQHGCCGTRLHTENEQKLTIYLGVEALERW